MIAPKDSGVCVDEGFVGTVVSAEDWLDIGRVVADTDTVVAWNDVEDDGGGGKPVVIGVVIVSEEVVVDCVVDGVSPKAAIMLGMKMAAKTSLQEESIG